MKTLGKVLGGLLLLLIAAVIIVPMVISSDDIVAKVSEQVKSNTGRTLSVDGNADFSVFPSLVLTLEKVRFANMAGGSQENMASMNKLDIHIPWLSIFSGDLVVDKFVIDKPEILLETNKQGVNNWTMLNAAKSVPVEQQVPRHLDKSPPPQKTQLPESFDINLGEIEIRNGALTMLDHATGDSKKLENLGLAISLPSLRQALKVKGTVTYMAQQFDLTTTIETPAKAIEEKPFQIEVDLDSKLLKLNYKGSVEQGGKAIAGHLSLLTDSVKDILAWQKQPLKAKDNAFNAFSLTGDIKFTGQTLTVHKIDAKFDALEFKGSAELLLAQIPKVTLEIDLGVLDLNPYLPEPVEKPPVPEDGPAQPIVWDDTPIDLTGLKALSADINVKSTALMARDIKLGSNRFHLMLYNGLLDLKMEEFNAYEGKGTGRVVVNAGQQPYVIETQFDLDGVDANPLLNDVAGFDKVLGKGSVNWQLTTKGQSQKDFVERLNGQFGFNFADGAVKGVNLAALARSAQNLLTGNLSGVSLDQDFNNAEKTDFAALIATFKFKDGVGSNDDLSLQNPFIDVSGKGTLDLPRTNINFKVKNKLTASIEGQASSKEKSGLTIPIKITGPFHKVKIRPDLSGAAKDKAKDDLKDKLKDKLKGLFG